MKSFLPFILPAVFLLWTLIGTLSMLRKQSEKETSKKYRLRRVFGLIWFLIGISGLTTSDISIAWLANTPQVLDKQSSSRLEGIVGTQTQAYFESHGAGLVVVAVADDEYAVMGFGRNDLAGSELINNQSVFEIGSLSKVFTGILLATQIENDVMRLDQTLAEVAPNDLVVSASVADSVTLQHLTTHTAGFPRLPSNMMTAGTIIGMLFGKDPYRDYSLQAFSGAVAVVEPTTPPGEAMLYSNFGVALLGHLITRQLDAGYEYEDAVRDRIFGPLEMTNTVVNVAEERLVDEVKGYRAVLRLGPVAIAIGSSRWKLPSHLAGAGGIRSTASDMHRFLMANMGLQASSIESAIERSHQELFKRSETRGIAMGWFRQKNNKIDDTVLWHNGGTGGYRSYLAFTEDKRFGVVVLSNTTHSPDALGLRILEELASD